MCEIFSNTVFVTQAPQYLRYSPDNSDTILALKLKKQVFKKIF